MNKDLWNAVLKELGKTNEDYKRDLEQRKSELENPSFVYDGIDLNEAKAMKMKELRFNCEKTILGYFKATINAVEYSFSNDMEAQSNFKDGMWALENNEATTVKWTCYDVNGNVVRLDLDLLKLADVNRARLMHQQTQVSKFRDTLQPQVEVATTIEEVEGITW